MKHWNHHDAYAIQMKSKMIIAQEVKKILIMMLTAMNALGVVATEQDLQSLEVETE